MQTSRVDRPTLTDEIASEIRSLAAMHGVRNIRLFGSFARGEATAESDLDLLVDLDPGRSLLDLIGFQQDIEERTGRKADVATERSLHPLIRDRVLAEAVAL